MRIERIGQSNNRVTKGEIYEVDKFYRIRDDSDRMMKPALDKVGYWLIVEEIQDCKVQRRIDMSTKVENVTLINGKPSDSYIVEDLIKLINKEENKVVFLSSINIESKAISDLKDKHNSTIKALIEVLENKE